MALTSTITAIKEYFTKWHNDNYEILHKTKLHTPLSTISNNNADNNKLVTNEAVRKYVNNSTTNANNIHVTINGQDKTVQTTLEQFNTDLGTITNNYIKKTDLAYYPNFSDSLYNYADDDGRGFSPQLNTSLCKDGLMTWQEKMNLKYVCEWQEFSGVDLGGNENEGKGMTIWVNPGLRLVYFNFKYSKCPYLKDYYAQTGETTYFLVPAMYETDVFYLVKPVGNIWAPTNNPNIIIGVNKMGEVYLSSYSPVTKNTTINASLMWFYRDGPVADKINS